MRVVHLPYTRNKSFISDIGNSLDTGLVRVTGTSSAVLRKRLVYHGIATRISYDETWKCCVVTALTSKEVRPWRQR